jgi:hypothetical protein
MRPVQCKQAKSKCHQPAITSGKNQMRVEFNFSCKTRLTYVLNDTWTAQNWAQQLSALDSRFLLQTDLNHRHGFASQEEIRVQHFRLAQCANALGFHLEPLTTTNWQSSLNQLHINFPEIFKAPLDARRFQLAHETNLLIHWLEYELVNVLNEREQYLFNLDFNHHPPAYNQKQAFPKEEMKYFSSALEFGNLHLHYIYIGRHFLEMFDARDMVCPNSHFKAQHEFNATCGLVFAESVDPVQQAQDMRHYFDSRGGADFFGFDLDDPDMAKGFFKLGQLENLNDYSTLEQRQALRDQLRSSRIVSWRFVH